MGRYATWSDCLIRYGDLSRVTSGDVNAAESSYIVHAENRVEARLASKYTVPFSSNNLTAKDLTIDMAYLMVMAVKDPEKTATLKELLDERFDNLLSGKEVMLTDAGVLSGFVGDTIWSTTQGYHPTFGVGDDLDFVVSSDRMWDEEDAR